MPSTPNIAEIIFELIMEILLLYVAYVFWKRYFRTSNRTLLFLAITFTLFFIAHTAVSLIMRAFMGYRFSLPLEPDHIYFLITLVILVFLVGKTRWRVNLRRQSEDRNADKNSRGSGGPKS